MKTMVIHKKEVTVLEAMGVLTSPTPEEKVILEEAIKILGVRNFLLNIEAYNFSEPTKEKLVDLRNIVEEFIPYLPHNDLKKGGGELG